MSMYQNLAKMMMIPGNKESWEKFNQRKQRGEIPASASIGGAIGIHGTWPNELAQYIEQARSGHASNQGQWDGAESKRRQYEVRGCVDDNLKVPLQQPVQDVEVGDEVEQEVLAQSPL